MPWERKTVVESRNQFVEAAERYEVSFAQLCREYGISRKTGYKWLKRSREGKSLCDESRKPTQSPGRTPPYVEQLILDVRKKHPAWGGKMIRKVLEDAGHVDLPSAKTCTNILKRNGYIRPEEAVKHRAFQRFEQEACNQLWQTDFKGEFLMQDGSYCYPLDILDDRSRFCIRIDAKSSASGVIDSFIRAFEEYGLPDAVLSDHGAQFAGFRGGYTQFERFLMDLDIEPKHGRVFHPQTQGKIERFHRTMKEEALRTMPNDLKEAQRRLNDWRWLYNEVRPHTALGMKTPASVYKASQRSYHEIKPYEYDSDARLVKVNNWGYLRFGPIRIYLSETMKDTYLEIRPMDGDKFSVIYRNFRIAIVDAQEKKLVNRHICKL